MKAWRVPNYGRAALRVELRSGRSVVVEQYSQAPLQLHRPLYLAKSDYPTVYLRSPSAGYLDGDEHHLAVHLESGSRLELRTQAASLVYPGRSRQVIAISVAAGGQLSFQPHPLILAAGANFHQLVRIDLSGDARLSFQDSWSAGRVAMGEKWCFDRFENSIEILIDGVLVCRERQSIDPQSLDVMNTVIGGRFTTFRTGYIFGGHSLGALPPAFADASREGHPQQAEALSWCLERGGNYILRNVSC